MTVEEKIRHWMHGREDELVEALAPLIAAESTRSEAKPGMPFGEGPAMALDRALELAQRWGFRTENHEGYVGTADLNEHADGLHILAHLDVVGAGDGWDTDPYCLVRDGDLIYGRGTDDDKGPLVVIRTPAINQVAVPHQAIGIRIPAIPRADYIQVRQNVQAVRMLVQIGGSHIPFVVFRPEAPALRQLQRPVQRHGGAFAKWHPRLCLRAGGLCRNQRRKRLYQLILPSMHPVSDFFFHSHDLLLLFFLHYSVFDKKSNDIPRNSL